MFNFGYIIKEDKKEHNSNWPEIPGHPYRTIIVGGSESVKTNALLNLINMNQIFIKLIFMKKIHTNHNINC